MTPKLIDGDFTPNSVTKKMFVLNSVLMVQYARNISVDVLIQATFVKLHRR